MAFDKTVEARIWGVTAQNSTLDSNMGVGDSASNAFTSIVNPLKGSLVWDRCMFTLAGVSITGEATGGSYTITLYTDLPSTTASGLPNYTAMPIAFSGTLGPLSPASLVLDNVHNSPASPRPTSMRIAQTAGGGTLTFQMHTIARQYRGTLGTPGSKTSERILFGDLIRGISSSPDFSGDEGVSADTTFTMGTSGSDLGMNRMRLWDTAFFWSVAGQTIAGTHDASVIGKVGGKTFTIAETGAAGIISSAGEKNALASNFYGQSPNPHQVIWTEVTAGGVSDFRVVMLAKSGRGSLAKR